MTFERIKIVKGHQYKYLVENVRENGKVKQKIIKYLGRVDKKRAMADGITLPYGVYYFSSDECEYCRSEDEIKESIAPYKRLSVVELPEIQYINLSRYNPTLIDIHSTPTIVDIHPQGVFVMVGSMCVYDWLRWKLGDKFNSIYEAIRKEKEKPKRKAKGKRDDSCKGGVCQLPS